MKVVNSILFGLFLGITGCSLDYQNTGAINPDNVWNDKKMIEAFITDIAGGMMPGWPVSANNTDEGMNGPGSMDQYARGQASVENSGKELKYEYIDKINFFLAELENVSPAVLKEQEKKQLAAQAYFWRAWNYWGKVNEVGGVPLILKPQDVSDFQSLLVERSTTSKCVEQILTDLDAAINDLPDQWNDDNYGRIDKGCAMAFKGRVLLWYASPLFNPDNN